MTPSLLTDSVTYNLERAVHYALLWGLEGVELRSIGGMHDRVPFVNEHQLRLRLTESNLPVVAVDPGTFAGPIGDRAAWLNELAELKETLRFCRRIECPRVIVSSFRADEDEGWGRAVDALAAAGRQAAAAGVRLCVLNEEGCLAPTGSRLAELLDAVDLEAVQAAWDPAAAVRKGEDADEGLAALGRRVGAVRCRNVARAGNGWEPRPIDNGEVDWSAQIRALVRLGYAGPLTLEVDVEPAAAEGLRGATELIRQLRSAFRDEKHARP